jgi:putative salt-induced outer membrane protein YdiY
MRATLTRLTLLVVAYVFVPACFADIITLKNGDHITGTIQRVEQGKVVISTDYAGEIKIDWQKITSLVTDNPVTVQLDDDSRIYGKISGDSSGIKVEPADGAQNRMTEVSHIENVYPGNALQEKYALSGRVGAGSTQTTGNTHTSTAHIDAEGIARKGRNRYTLGGEYNRAADHGDETASNARLYGKYDHFFTKKWYGIINATANHDRFADIQFRGTGGAGIGYQVYETARTNLTLETGLEYVYTNYYAQATESYPAVRLATKYDYFLIPSHLQYFFTGEYYIGQGGNEPSFSHVQTGLRVPLFTNFLATIQYNVDWNGHPPPGFVHYDKMLLLTLGYHW